MIKVEEHEAIRRAYFVEEKSIREIAREHHHGRDLIRRTIASPEPARYTLQEDRDSPVLGPYKERIRELVAANKSMPRKQRYTGDKIFELIRIEGYPGAASTVRGYVAQCRRDLRKPKVFLPLEFEPGQDAQVDWGEAVVYIGGCQVIVQIFVMRLNYSRVRFVMAFPFQKQEAFFEGHVQAFHFFGAVPRRISYDNLKVAVYRILEGRKRQEQEHFITFRSYYLFESFFCTPGKGNEKGGVESDVGFSRRNFLVPIPRVDSFEELNAHLRQKCLEATERRMRGQSTNIAGVWEAEKPYLLPLPERDFACCVSRPVKANAYSQVTYESNRYSVPPDYADRQLVLRAFPFRIEVLYLDQVIAAHPRCFGREQDVYDPLHYLDILEQRPGAFDYAAPIRRWRQHWPAIYEQLLEELQAKWPEGRGVREFIRILQLHREHNPDLVEQAVRQALQVGGVHLDGVTLCLRQILHPEQVPAPLDLQEFPQLVDVGRQPVELDRYNQLLAGR